jgi:hypothetical protein
MLRATLLKMHNSNELGDVLHVQQQCQQCLIVAVLAATTHVQERTCSHPDMPSNPATSASPNSRPPHPATRPIKITEKVVRPLYALLRPPPPSTAIAPPAISIAVYTRADGRSRSVGGG